MKEHLKANWKKYALAAAVAAAASYGVSPEATESFVRGACSALGAC
jgi:hypothetical protein